MVQNVSYLALISIDICKHSSQRCHLYVNVTRSILTKFAVHVQKFKEDAAVIYIMFHSSIQYKIPYM